MSTIQPLSYAYQAQNAQRIAPQPAVYKAPEAFEGEAQFLKNIYDNYMKNVGGFQNIDGQMVHVTTVLHTDRKAQEFVMAVEDRLRDLGVLPPMPQMPTLRSSAKQIWANPTATPQIYQ